MGLLPEVRHALHVSLKGRDNETYRGTLVLKNWTLLYPGGLAPPPSQANDGLTTPVPGSQQMDDPMGASYYVIAVVLVYGMSIVLLIASHVNRKHQKMVEDRQIHKYLQEFMIVKEKSSRENYKNLKKSIVQKLNWERNPTYRNLSRAIIPAIAVPVGRQLKTLTEAEMEAETGLLPAAVHIGAAVDTNKGGGRLTRGSSPATSFDFPDTHTAAGDRKQRRKGMGHLFGSSSTNFTHSVLERLSELNEIRQETRVRLNSIAQSSTEDGSAVLEAFHNVSSLRRQSRLCSAASGSLVSIGDSNSDTDSHVTLPAITVCPPPQTLLTSPTETNLLQPGFQPSRKGSYRSLTSSPLPTIEDNEHQEAPMSTALENKSREVVADVHESSLSSGGESSDSEQATVTSDSHKYSKPPAIEDRQRSVDEVWTMGQVDNAGRTSPSSRHTAGGHTWISPLSSPSKNGNYSTSPLLKVKGYGNSKSFPENGNQRRQVRFNPTVKRKSDSGRGLALFRQQPATGEDQDDSDLSGSEGSAMQITCV